MNRKKRSKDCVCRPFLYAADIPDPNSEVERIASTVSPAEETTLPEDLTLPSDEIIERVEQYLAPLLGNSFTITRLPDGSYTISSNHRTLVVHPNSK